MAEGITVLIYAVLELAKIPKRNSIPIFRNQSYLSLFVAKPSEGLRAGLPHFHANPIFSRCRFTFASSSAKRPIIFGSGVS